MASLRSKEIIATKSSPGSSRKGEKPKPPAAKGTCTMMIALAVILALQPSPAAAPGIPVNPFAGPHQENTYTYAVSPGATVNVTTPSGRIAVEAGEPGKIIVVASRRAATQQAIVDLHADVTQNGNDVTAAARLPANCAQDCSVSFQIQVPPDTNIVAHSDSGSVGINDVSGSVTASTVHGPILCGGLSGNATLGAQEGMVNGGFRDVSHVTHMELGTGSGTVRVVLPPNAAIAEIKAGTGDGAIHSEWPLAIAPKGTGASGEGHFGNAGPVVLAGTGKGDVDIVKAP